MSRMRGPFSLSLVLVSGIAWIAVCSRVFPGEVGAGRTLDSATLTKASDYLLDHWEIRGPLHCRADFG